MEKQETPKKIKTPAPTHKEFNVQFPTDDSCLELMFQKRYGNLHVCPSCEKETKFHRVSNRKCFACQYCGHQLHPLADTIFHKSSTSLKDWFFAIYLFSISKNGVAAKELERELGVTYKCAWRMAKQIRTLFDNGSEPKSKLKGTIEADETYYGGKERNKHASKKTPGTQGRSVLTKTPIIGIVQREGEIRAVVTTNTTGETIVPFIKKNVELGSEIMTDEYKPYQVLAMHDYQHEVVFHASGEYVSGKAHTNTMEGFWSQLKRSINGTYHAVSPKYLHRYLDEFSWRYNHRRSEVSLFSILLGEYVQKTFSPVEKPL
jgi:transposase-like protein